MSGLPEDILQKQPFIEGDGYQSKYTVMITGKNVGCGSSREHAPLALAMAGVKCVIAEDYARIFYRNAVDGGFITPFETSVRIVDAFKTNDEVEIDTDTNILKNVSSGKTYQLNDLGSAKDIIDAGGLFKYAKTLGLIK